MEWYCRSAPLGVSATMCQELGAILPDLDRAYFKIWPCLGPGSDRVSFSEQLYSTCALRVNSIPSILSMARHALFFKKSGALNVSDMAGRQDKDKIPVHVTCLIKLFRGLYRDTFFLLSSWKS